MNNRRRNARAALAAAAALLAVAALALAAGCGGDDDSGEEEPAGADLTAVVCPMEEAGEVDGITQYEPAEDAFDTAELVGLEINEARETAGDHGCEIVIAIEDGEGLPVPIEIDPTRIYVYVEDDVVTEVEGVGGGL